MSQAKIDFDAVREIGLTLPDVKDGTTHRGFALKVRGKLLACHAINKSAEPKSLMVQLSFDERERLLAADPDVYYLTDHYVGYPCILVRLSKISRAELRTLLMNAWQFMTDGK